MKTLTIDIETRPLVSHTWSMWNVNIGLPQLIDPGGVICFAAKWKDDRKVHFYSDFHHDHETMIGKAYELLDEADAVVHFNGTKFDLPWLNREFVMAGYTPHSPVKEIDLLRVVRRQFKFASNRLDHVAQQLGIGAKTKHTGHQLWIDCIAGDPAAWKLMKKYNIQDTVLEEKLYLRLLPWITNHPNVPLLDGETEVACPNCSGKNFQRRGYQVALTGRYPRIHCQDCGAWSRLTKRESSVPVAGVK